MEQAGCNVARHNRGMAFSIRERNFPTIEPQIIDSLLLIRTMTGVAIVRQDRADVPIEVDPPYVVDAPRLRRKHVQEKNEAVGEKIPEEYPVGYVEDFSR